MDSSSSLSPEPDPSTRSRSGRVVKPPTKYVPEPSAAVPTKRKRNDEAEGASGDDDEEGEGDGQEDEEMLSDEGLSDAPPSGAESDEDHAAPKPRKPSQSDRPKRPTAKKPKTNGGQSQPAAAAAAPKGILKRSIPSRPKPKVRIDTGDKGTGLYADIFGSGDSSESIAHQWWEKYRQDNATAMCDLVNCILQCSGCDLEVTIDDIRDPDNIPSRLRDLQSVYQEQQIVEYPLIAKAKSIKPFRDLLVAFFRTLVVLLHETDILYKDQDLIDNLHSWLASMSSSALRPFRHTATTISLTVHSALIEVVSVLDQRIANIEQQARAVNKSKNKDKAAEIQRNLQEAGEHRKIVTHAINSFFETVFVHRYRDIDPKIRVECVEALGAWIWNLPTMFMEPGYLRYLGWMLSDTNPTTRQEVLKQLLKVFKRDAERLGHFIDRFRPRLIEMATLDSEVSVRAAAISVIDSLRAAALLEPTEIDAIGKLIFDAEIRIRKAVVGFFVACINDVLEGKIEEMGGSDVLDELDGANESDYEAPRKEWLNIKCLAETLAIYDAQIEESQQDAQSLGLDAAVDLFEGASPDTRISLAAQVLYEKVPEIRSWEILAGYLLFDHSTSTKSKPKSKGSSVEDVFRAAVAPTPEEEIILLDVLSSAVKTSLSQAAEHDKGKRRAPRSEAAEAQDDIALELAAHIPKLLNKYGAEPETAAIVLRLEHCLNLDVFQHLRQDSRKYEKLLDEISTQFNRHDDKRVLSEAATALLHARQYPELEELTDSKLAVLWETVINSLRNFDEACELSIRGNLTEARLKELSNVLMKISKLASISDCVDVLEAAEGSPDSASPVCKILVNIVHRGKFEPQEEEGIDDLEDEVVSLAIKASQFYFMWKTRALFKQLFAGSAISEDQLTDLSVLRQSYRKHLIETFSSRAMIDQVRLFATGSLIDLHLTFATLRPSIHNFRPSSSAAQPSSIQRLPVLIQEIEPALVPELMAIFDAAEKQYAKKARKDKTLNEPAEDEDPIDDEEEPEEPEEDEGLTKEERHAAELRAEKALCELTGKYVLAITGSLIDNRDGLVNKLRRRMERNETKLGNNFKEIIAYLDEEKLAKRHKKPPAKSAAAATATTTTTTTTTTTITTTSGASNKPQKRVLSGESLTIEDDEIEDDDDDDVFEEVEPEEGSREDLRRRELVDDPIEDGEDEGEGEKDRQSQDRDDDDDSDDDVIGD
ncbi:Cohesin subunit psc3 [Escovopsis weberi]|uniref:Cohesin subunit psc3 n=1 Tax=Escovopsis weberi TaxID=150374 RepID=A0A0M8MUH1_ESCWE|nr:Cohesin subunit psc3 [Escovopsis weberi]